MQIENKTSQKANTSANTSKRAKCVPWLAPLLICIPMAITLSGCIFSDDSYNDLAIAEHNMGNRTKRTNVTINHQEGSEAHNSSATNEMLSAYSSNDLNLFNRYLIDIDYKLIQTKLSFVAIGEKFTVQNTPYSSVSSGTATSAEKNIDNLLSDNTKFKKRKISADEMSIEATTFKNLNDWDLDNFDDAMESFFQSCKLFITKERQHHQVESKRFKIGDIKDWNELCKHAISYAKQNKSKQFFEDYFTPFVVYDNTANTNQGKFTGYYEYGIRGSFKQHGAYQYPIYRMPKECKKGNPCATRKEISRGSLRGRNLEICYTDDPINLWQMQLQGSGIVELEDGNYVRLSFAGSNNQAYESIWHAFDEKKEMPPPPKGTRYSSLDRKNWLRDHPKRAIEVLNSNPSYIFFAPNNNTHAIGATGYGVTPSRTIAVDPTFIPYGLPVWLETKVPVKDKNVQNTWLPLHRLVVAQDTGSAIKGPIRADIFFGHGDKAVYLANNTSFPGRYYVLIPTSMINQIEVKK